MKKAHLVLLPGLDGTGLLFEPFIQQFASTDAYTIVRYPTDRYIPYEKLQDYITSVIPHDRPLVIVGESYSGPAAIQLAAHSNLDIRGIVLVATFARFPASLLTSLSRILPLSLLIRLPIPAFLIKHYCFGQGGDPQLIRLLRQAINKNDPSVFSRRARDGARIDVRCDLKRLTVPCLYLQASNDKLVPKSAAADMKAGNHNVRVVEIDGPHFILQRHPRQCYALINNEMTIEKDRRD